MIKLNRTTEYGLMALRHMSRKDSTAFTSAREVSDIFGLPFEITAKTLQRMRDTGLIQSAQGARGGYTLERSLREITLAEFLELMEGPQTVVACAGKSAAAAHGEAPVSLCEYKTKCDMSSVLGDLNARFIGFLSGIRLSELTETNKPILNSDSYGPASYSPTHGDEP
jgi:Rrf2 family protein